MQRPLGGAAVYPEPVFDRSLMTDDPLDQQVPLVAAWRYAAEEHRKVAARTDQTMKANSSLAGQFGASSQPVTIAGRNLGDEVVDVPPLCHAAGHE